MNEVIVRLTADHIKVKGGEYVQDLVRCRECRYKDMDICPMYRLVVAGVRKYDDFCSYGERDE